MKTKLLIIAIVAGLGLTAAARAQTWLEATTLPSADANATAAELWKDISPEELEKLLQRAEESRLADERVKASDEIRDSLLLEEDAKEAAIKAMHDKPANTRQDNIDRICKAMAKVDTQFGKYHKLLAEGKHLELTEALKSLDHTQSSYLNTAKHYLYAKALAGLSQDQAKENKGKESRDTAYQALAAYQELLASMPERISFAVASALESAEMYEKLGRFIYASEMLTYCARNYGLVFSTADFQKLTAKVEGWQKIYKDPLAHIGGRMGEVEQKLNEKDSGPATQEKEKEIVAVLEDLIRTLEEKEKNNQSQSQSQDKDKKKGEKGEEGGKEQKQGQAQGQGGPPNGNNPSSPAQKSAVVPGSVERPRNLGTIHPTDETSDWSSLPPRERDRLQQIMKKVMSERNRDLVSDYHSSLSQEQK